MNDHHLPKAHEDAAAVTKMPELLSDKLESEDFFGAHSAIAGALSELVLNDNEGRCVALQGSWGSGKSTVIDFLTKKLAGKADIFMFDTWSNQGDPLRFSFMGAFASWVEQEFPDLAIDARAWGRDIEDTARRATREERGPHKIKPKEAQTLAASLLIGLPVGTALASDQWAKLIPDAMATGVYFVGLALVLAPFGYLAYLWWTKGLNIFQEIVEAIEKAADETKRIVVRRGPLATSIEFNRKIKTFCTALHERAPKRKLLIIFDNIDRVAERNSPKVWSLLTALLEAVHDKKSLFASNIWVLVPVDLDSVPMPVSMSRTGRRGTDGKAVTADGLKLEFIEKAFQLNIVVPPPLSVKSERYFEKQFKLAFGSTDAEADWYEVYSILREIRGSEQAFTPRATKRMINDLVGLWRSRHQIDKDHMPSIALLTLYLCARERIKHPNDVLQGIYSESVAPHISDANPIAVLAAVAFGDKVSAGLQILVRARVEAALESGDIKDFEGLAGEDGFAEAFATYIKAHGGTWLTNDISMLARSYDLIGKLDDGLQKEIAGRLKGITNSLIRVDNVPGAIDRRVAVGMAQAIYFASALQDRGADALAAILWSITSTPAENASIGALWFDCVDAFLTALTARSLAVEGLEIELPHKEVFAVQVLRGDVRMLKDKHKVTFTIAEEVLAQITKSLVGEASGFNFNDHSVIVTKCLRAISKDFKSEPICKQMEARFTNANGIQADVLAAAVEILDDTVRWSQDKAFVNQVTEWMKTGFMHHHYQQAQGEKPPRLTSRLISLMAGLKVASNEVRQWNQSPPGLQSLTTDGNALRSTGLQSAFDYLVVSGRIHAVISMAGAFNMNPLREGLLRLMLTRRPTLYNAERYCDDLSEIFDAFSEGLRADLTKFAIETLKVDEYLISLEGQEPNLGFIGYKRIGEAIVDSERQKAFYKKVAQLLCDMPLDWWQNTVKANDQILLTLVNAISQSLDGGWLSGEARKVTGEWVVKPQFMSDAARKGYTIALLNALSKTERTVILGQVTNKALAQPGDPTEFARIKDIQEFMFTDDEVLGDINRIIISVLVPAVEHDQNNRQTVLDMATRFSLVEKASGEAKKRLMEAFEPSKPPPDTEKSA